MFGIFRPDPSVIDPILASAAVSDGPSTVEFEGRAVPRWTRCRTNGRSRVRLPSETNAVVLDAEGGGPRGSVIRKIFGRRSAAGNHMKQEMRLENQIGITHHEEAEIPSTRDWPPFRRPCVDPPFEKRPLP